MRTSEQVQREALQRIRTITIRPWQRKWLWWMTYLCIGSGVGIFYLKFFVEKDYFSVWIHPTHPWLVAIHLITSPILIFAVGSLMLFHVIPHSRGYRLIRSGVWVVVILTIYAIIGVLLLRLVSEPVAVILFLGLVAVSLAVWHLLPYSRPRRHFWSGVWLLVTFAIYATTGMFLFFLFPEEVIDWMKRIHTVSGFVFYPFIGYHWWVRNEPHRNPNRGSRRGTAG